MSETVFTKVDYDLGTLVKFILLGEIGLPHIQRPFVWKNSKVRDLFDSMYRGYPVGYFLFWQNTVAEDSRVIGSDKKQKPPRLVIVDGQQRLTSLYAVIKNIPVLREDYETEKIRIAFNPLEEKFEVADAAIDRDKSFIPDISIIWDEKTDLFEVVERYLEELSKNRTVTEKENKAIKKGIGKLHGLLSFPFTALELIPDISEESVSDVFVRINSKGTPLNQADFILTLMSVFWDEGRAALESFCRVARVPAKDAASPFNHFIEPSPDQLLRVGIGVAFKRARLQYVYSILRGKDLETGTFSAERRIQQFDLLKNAQERVLNIQYWHDFMNCLKLAGFRGARMISSQNNLIFSYILYLIGRTEYKVPEFDLRHAIARWYFMSALTGRFTGSPEGAMEYDLAGLRSIKTADDFKKYLSRICDIALTKDFWAVGLPNDLATSSPRSPSLFAYNAALVLLEARALFSKNSIADLLDPSVRGNRLAAERHHIFPAGYLKSKGMTEIRDINQIANYAYVEWGDNADIEDTAPAEYLPEYKSRFKKAELERMYHWHALPSNWEKMSYKDFLEKRREMIAQVIQEGYALLMAGAPQVAEEGEFDIRKLVVEGESEEVEFKSAIRTNLHTGKDDPRIEYSVLKTIAGFLNTNGGTLLIGLADDGSPVGIQVDRFENEDKAHLHLVDIIKSRLGILAVTNLHTHFEDHNGCRIIMVQCMKSPVPVYLKEGDTEHFFIRTGPSTTELSASQIQAYIKQRFEK
jgi:hypothetical protein